MASGAHEGEGDRTAVENHLARQATWSNTKRRHAEFYLMVAGVLPAVQLLTDRFP